MRLLTVALALGAIGCGGVAPTLSADDRAVVEAAHTRHAWILPTALEINGAGFVVADYELAAGAVVSPRYIAESRLLGIREALLARGFRDFRVNVNGPSPGSGLIRRYGSARLVDGGNLEWLTP